MTRIRWPGAAARLLFALAATSALAYGCAQNPSGDTRCVLETGDVATGRCLTECESQCNLEAQAGCASDDCVTDCEKSAATRGARCEDARYAYWRCLRVQGLPEARCSAGKPTLLAPEGTCRDEREAASTACPAVDAGVEDARARPDAGP